MAGDSYLTGAKWRYIAVILFIIALLSQIIFPIQFCLLFSLGAVACYVIGLFIED